MPMVRPIPPAKTIAVVLGLAAFICISGPLNAQKITIDRNKPERKEWFQRMGFGMFIHWSIDVQLGAIISHNVAVGSKEYQDRYFRQLPATFDPRKFDPEVWADLASLAGMKYVVFTAKHHNGFCMWDSETTDFDITSTRYEGDILEEIISAFRARNIAIGLYFSPDDYHVMYTQGLPPSRVTPESESPRNSALWEINKKQLRELLTNYGKIDILFIDEKSDWANPLVANYAWDIDPDLLITRGGLPTPEQQLPDQTIEGPWEACYTIGWHWQYVAEEYYKDATELIQLWIETRAKGGNLLLNVGPDAHGEIPPRQESRLREIALWHMANHEAVDGVVPWKTVQDQDVWYTSSRDGKSIYAFVHDEGWNWMEERAFFLRPVRGNKKTMVEVLGQNDAAMEYTLQRSPKPLFGLHDNGLFISVIKAQRLNKTWDNPLVIKITNASHASD
jgi:alpha-L-fucosidase